MAALWLFALIVAPLSLLIGVGAAAVGFTAWGILVPLCLDGFGMDVVHCVFLSSSVDVVNSALLSLWFLHRRRLNLFLVLAMGTPAMLSTVVVFLLFGRNFMDDYQMFFKGTTGFLVLIAAAAFWVKGFMDRRKRSLLASLDVQEGENDDEEGDGKRSWPDVFWGPSQLLLFSGRCQSSQATSARLAVLYLSIQHIVICEIVGAVSALLGMGGGTIFVLVLVIGFPHSIDIVDATGTSVCIMFMCMTSLWVCMVTTDQEVRDDLSNLLPEMSIAIASSVVGLLLGAWLLQRIPKSWLVFCIAAVITVVGSIATVQPLVLSTCT
eukprot:TRINITY_DN3266_c0_g1_i2.p1 TRINITY_DN3266_c0_g1~~TRINITY_DN3266_c0_g1_i2.p1  ORF type:complete len:323 (-),score=96.88 TRINITY_DN3266_c0_g1_i2:680-1648(-)